MTFFKKTQDIALMALPLPPPFKLDKNYRLFPSGQEMEKSVE